MAKGEGSRGGKIVRHTKGGFAVYAHRDHESTSKKITKTIGYGAAGIGTSAIGGGVAGKMARTVAHAENLSKGASKASLEAASKAEKFVIKHKIVQEFLMKGHTSLRVAAAVAGTGLLYKAASSAIEGSKYDTEDNKVMAATAAAMAAGFVTRSAEGFHLSPDKKTAIKNAFKKIKKPLS